MSDNMDDYWCDYYEWLCDDANGQTITEEEIEIECRLINRTWVTKEGEVLNIKDMDTSHIINCIKMINRNRWCYAYEYTKLFEAELKRRGIEWI